MFPNSSQAASIKGGQFLRNRQDFSGEAKSPDFTGIRCSAYRAFLWKPVSRGITIRNSVQQRDRVRWNKSLFLHTKDTRQWLLTFNAGSKRQPFVLNWNDSGISHDSCSESCTRQPCPTQVGSPYLPFQSLLQRFSLCHCHQEMLWLNF